MILYRKLLQILTIGYIGLSVFATNAQTPTNNPTQSDQPIRHVFNHAGIEREYFVWLPRDFCAEQTYWVLVSAHGGGSNGKTFWLSSDLKREADNIGLEVIIVSPSFLKENPNLQRFPVLGEGTFLKHMIEEVNNLYQLHPKILLTGYSRGAQFAHRFALWYPDMVHASAPLSAGSWTTPGGRFLMYKLGEVKDPESYLASPENGEGLKASQKNLFDPHVAKVAGRPASSGAEEIPFLVMCGTLDERYEVSKEFAQSLKSAGYIVNTVWPETMHGGRNKDEYRAEFGKYSHATVAFFSNVSKSAKQQSQRHTYAHAHNDYLHERPLFDALDNGFSSVEADVFLENGELLIGHDLSQLSPERTLVKLYLDPLAKRIQTNGGRVQKNAKTFYLLIDFKSDGETTYARLKKELIPYHSILTEFTTTSTKKNAVTIIISGNRPKSTIMKENQRWAGYDGRISDLGSKHNRHLMPWISDNWRSHFKWDGHGTLSIAEQSKLDSFVHQAHSNGQMIRFWAAPDMRTSWAAQQDAGVDLINSDRLKDLGEFLNPQDSQ